MEFRSVFFPSFIYLIKRIQSFEEIPLLFYYAIESHFGHINRVGCFHQRLNLSQNLFTQDHPSLMSFYLFIYPYVHIFFIYSMENNEKLNFDATLYKSPEEWTGGQI